ncbi:MAG: hypothetical protein OEO77_06765 [Acidimicrobiia bacterium]|nr:hypothetical protein [Acidimicrobiia bacterium]
MRAFRAIAVNVARRLLQRRVAIALVLATSAHALVILLAPAGDVFDAYHGFTVLLYLAFALPIAALVTATAAFGDEKRESTLPYLVVKPVGRLTIASAVTFATVGTIVLVGLPGVIASSVIGAIRLDEPAIGLAAIVALLVAAVGYAAVFVPLGLLFERATLAGLAYIFVWESILAFAATTLAASSIWRIGLTAYVDLADGSLGDVDDALAGLAPGLGGAAAKVAVLLGLSVGFSTWILKRRDLA